MAEYGFRAQVARSGFLSRLSRVFSERFRFGGVARIDQGRAVDIQAESHWTVSRSVLFDREGAEELVVVAKRSFQLSREGEVTGLPEAEAVRLADEYLGEPGESGLAAEAEVLAAKPATDVLLSGHAIPGRPGDAKVNVEIRVGARTQRAIVFGPRRWKQTLGVRRISSPEPFERIPLIWENAFGGSDLTPRREKSQSFEERNPVGRGYFAKGSRQDVDGAELPNIEHPEHRIRFLRDRPPPVGFRPVAPSWQPRCAFAGSYDQDWLDHRAPLLPDDFDERFNLSAPSELRGEDYLEGGESCRVAGTVESGAIEFRLPVERPEVRLRFKSASVGMRTDLSTVHVDTDAMRLHLIWGGRQRVHGRVESLRAIEVGTRSRR